MKKKKIFNHFLMLSLGLLLSAGAMAQQGNQQGRSTPEERAARMTEQYKTELNLSEDQVAKLTEINKRATASMQELRNSTTSREDRMTKMRAIWEEQSAEIKAMLTEEQKQKFEVMEKQRTQRMQQRAGQRPANNQGAR